MRRLTTVYLARSLATALCGLWIFTAGVVRAQTSGWTFFGESPQPQSSFFYNPSPAFYNPNPAGSGPSRVEYAPAPKRHTHHKAAAVIQHEEAGKPGPYEPPIAGAGPLGPFINDPTLRKGDIVVTSLGLRVFQGPRSEAHAAREFIALENAYFSNKRHFVELTQIEQSNRKYASHFEVADAAETTGDGQALQSKAKHAFVVLEVNRK